MLCPILLAFSQALSNVSNADAARRLAEDYSHNILHVVQAATNEWNDSNPRNVRDAFPANMPFQLVVGPDPADKAAAEKAIATVTNAMPEKVRANYLARGAMAAALQRILRRNRPGVTNENLYASALAHRTVWRARDFDNEALADAALLMPLSVPLVVRLRPVYEEYEPWPIRRATPLADYADPRPETVYETLFGIAIVLRAPEGQRKFRFTASSWPVSDPKVSFKWVPMSTQVSHGGARVGRVQGQYELRPETGNAEIVLDWSAIRGRQDVAVFARYGDGPYGPPSVISFYVVPNEKRTYDKSGRIAEIEYRKTDWVIPQLFQNKPWKDVYEIDQLGNLIGFSRTRTGDFRSVRFGLPNEIVTEAYVSDLPKRTHKVRYFTRPDDPLTLDFEETDEEIKYPDKPFEPRTRGEFPTAVRRGAPRPKYKVKW